MHCGLCLYSDGDGCKGDRDDEDTDLPIPHKDSTECRSERTATEIPYSPAYQDVLLCCCCAHHVFQTEACAGMNHVYCVSCQTSIFSTRQTFAHGPLNRITVLHAGTAASSGEEQ
jgi:hypothetical protein